MNPLFPRATIDNLNSIGVWEADGVLIEVAASTAAALWLRLFPQLPLALALETPPLNSSSWVVASRIPVSEFSPAAANPILIAAQVPGYLNNTMRVIKKSQNVPK